MKELICFAAVAVMMLIMVCPALAVEASYKDGRVVVSTGDDGYFEILVDGIWVGRWVGTGHSTDSFPMKLEPGEHTVKLFSVEGGGDSCTFIVEAESQSDPQPTKKPENPEKPEEHIHTPSVAPATEPSHGVDGKTEGAVCAVCGQEIQPQFPIYGESHQYAVIKRTDKKVTYECQICGETVELDAGEPVGNRFGDIIVNEENGVARYVAAADAADEKTIVLTLDKDAEKVELTLKNALIMQIIREGYTAVRVVNGKIEMTVDLYKITPSWFTTEAKIESYHFAVDSEANVTVQATADGERLTAEDFAGVTVK